MGIEFVEGERAREGVRGGGEREERRDRGGEAGWKKSKYVADLTMAMEATKTDAMALQRAAPARNPYALLMLPTTCGTGNKLARRGGMGGGRRERK